MASAAAAAAAHLLGWGCQIECCSAPLIGKFEHISGQLSTPFTSDANGANMAGEGRYWPPQGRINVRNKTIFFIGPPSSGFINYYGGLSRYYVGFAYSTYEYRV